MNCLDEAGNAEKRLDPPGDNCPKCGHGECTCIHCRKCGELIGCDGDPKFKDQFCEPGANQWGGYDCARDYFEERLNGVAVAIDRGLNEIERLKKLEFENYWTLGYLAGLRHEATTLTAIRDSYVEDES